MDKNEALDIIIENFTTHTLVTGKSGWLYSLVASSSGTAAKYIDVYDGLNTNGKKLFRIYNFYGNTASMIFNVPIRFKKGLYIRFEFNTESLTVQYKSDY